MTDIRLYKELFRFFTSYDKDNTKNLIFENCEEVANCLLAANIDAVNVYNGLEFNKKLLPFSFYVDREEFERQASQQDFSKVIIIMCFDNEGTRIYAPNTYDGNDVDEIYKLEDQNFYFQNAQTYFEAIEFFKGKQVDSNGLQLVDYVNESSNIFIFISLADKCKVHFNFTSRGFITLDSSINYQVLFNDFSNLLEGDSKAIIFLKRSLVKKCSEAVDECFRYFFTYLHEIIKECKNNYNVYLHELSLDKLKSDYRDYQQKFINQQNEVLSKLSNQVISLPISVSATLFAITKVKDEFWAILIICFALILYLFFVLFITKIFKSDIGKIKIQSELDYLSLSDHIFFNENPDELNDFRNIKLHLENRLDHLRKGLISIPIVLIITGSLICLYILSMFSVIDLCKISWVIVISTCILILSLFYLKDDDK